MIDDVIRAYVKGATAEGYAEDWDLEQLWTSLRILYPIGVTIEDVEEEAGGERAQIDAEFLEARLIAGRTRGVHATRGGVLAGDHAAGRAGRTAPGDRPQVARAPVRDGLPAGRHRPAGARPA